MGGATFGLPAFLPNTTDWYGRWRLAANSSNDYALDREKQRAGDYTGIQGIHLQDQCVTESMGPVVDRRNERLGTSDAMIIRTRQRLLQAARALRADGTTPPGVDRPEAYRVRAGGVLLPRGADWLEATRHLRVGFAEHADLDSRIAGNVPGA